MNLLNIVKYGFRTQGELSEADVKTGIRLFTADGVCVMSMLTLQGGPFLPAFAIALGAGNYEVGLLASIGFLAQLMQLPGLYLMRKVPSRRGMILIGAGISRILWLFIILIPLLFLDRGVTFLMQWLFLAAMIGAVGTPAWNSLMRDVVPEKRMGSVFGRRMILGNVAVLIIMICGGYFVDVWGRWFPDASLYAYSILFAFGLIFGIASLTMFARIPEPRYTPGPEPGFARTLFKPLRDHNFRKVVIFICAWSFSINMAAPFFIVYMLTRIELPLKTVTALFVVSLVTNMVFMRIWGRISDRYSNKSVLIVSAPLFLAAILGWTFTTMPERYILTMPLLVGIHILSGISLSGISLATMNLALKMSPKGDAHAYTAVYGIGAACAAAVAPVIAGMFADFFAVRELSITVNWAEPGRELAVYALNIKALDFLFVLAFAVGLVSLRCLRRIQEKGEVEERIIRDELRSEFTGTLRDATMIPGVRQLISLPLSGAVYLIGRRAGRKGRRGNNGPIDRTGC